MSKALFALGALILVVFISWVIFFPHPGKTPVADVPPPTDTVGWQTYSNPDFGFQIQIPEGYTVKDSYYYHALGPGKEIPGVLFTVPAALSQGTNLSSDSGISVEELARAACTPSDFLPVTTPGEPVSLGSNTYRYAASSDAGAGNLYDESIYVLKNRDVCYGIRFFIHSTNIGNYDPGTVREFDKAGLVSSWKTIASTIQFI